MENLFDELFLFVDIFPQSQCLLAEWFVNVGEVILKGQKMGRMEDGKEISSPVNGIVHSLLDTGTVYDLGTSISQIEISKNGYEDKIHKEYDTSPMINLISHLNVLSKDFEGKEGNEIILQKIEEVKFAQRKILLQMYKMLQYKNKEVYSDYALFQLPPEHITKLSQIFPSRYSIKRIRPVARREIHISTMLTPSQLEERLLLQQRLLSPLYPADIHRSSDEDDDDDEDDEIDNKNEDKEVIEEDKTVVVDGDDGNEAVGEDSNISQVNNETNAENEVGEEKLEDKMTTEMAKIFEEEKIVQQIGQVFSGISLSTYPFNRERGYRDGEPICDQYKAIISPEHTIVAVADGCNWGVSPQEAAVKAAAGFVSFLSKNLGEWPNIQELSKLCLKAIENAHNQIIKGKSSDCSVGTTTLLGGILIKVDPSVSASSLSRTCLEIQNGIRIASSSNHQGGNLTSNTWNAAYKSYTSPIGSTAKKSLFNKYIQNGELLPLRNSLDSHSNANTTTGKKSGLNSHTTIIRRVKTMEKPKDFQLDLIDIKLRNDNKIKRTESENATSKSPDNSDQIDLRDLQLDRFDNVLNIDIEKLNSIIKDKKLNEYNDSKKQKNWIFLFANIGDCKAFKYNCQLKKMEEITTETRRDSPSDLTDCGGRLGPYINDGPDLRNLKLSIAHCKDGDIIILCTDGVHDNFDPEIQGKTPQEIGLPYKHWSDSDLNPLLINQFKSKYQLQSMENLIKECENVTPQLITEKFTTFCQHLTERSRNFLETYMKKLPEDYKNYPGKMDHTSIVAIKVGDHSADLFDPQLNEQLVDQFGVKVVENEAKSSFYHSPKNMDSTELRSKLEDVCNNLCDSPKRKSKVKSPTISPPRSPRSPLIGDSLISPRRFVSAVTAVTGKDPIKEQRDSSRSFKKNSKKRRSIF